MSLPHNTAAWPGLASPVFTTGGGTPYLRAPGVQVIARSTFAQTTLREFLGGFPDTLDFDGYCADPTPLSDASGLCKAAGQLCYMSFGPRRTTNADAARYFANILSSGHGSVLEHATFTLLLYGISRSVTHELVRHRAGFAFSQVSQRYVTGKVLRFVERPEFQDDGPLHTMFEARIDRVAADHRRLEAGLRADMVGDAPSVRARERTAERKRVQQAARALLPNETEAPIIVTGNVRAWRHFLEARCNEHADVEIRVLAFGVYTCLVQTEALLFGDYSVVTLPDGTSALKTETPKV